MEATEGHYAEDQDEAEESMKFARDFQRKRVYDWEELVLRPTEEDLSFEQCVDLINMVWVAEGQGRWCIPTVTDGRGRRTGQFNYHTNTIKLPRYARRPYYVLHEVAHAMTPATPWRAWHGPEWCRTYLRLLQTYANWADMKRSMKEFGIKS